MTFLLIAMIVTIKVPIDHVMGNHSYVLMIFFLLSGNGNISYAYTEWSYR